MKIPCSAITLVLLLAQPQTSMAVWYTITDLGTLGGFTSSAYALNDRGQIVGKSAVPIPNESTYTTHAFLYANGTMIDLGTLGGSSSGAYDINDSGQIVGTASTASAGSHAFLYSDGIMADLGSLGDRPSSAAAINNSGQVVGYCGDRTWDLLFGNFEFAFVYDGFGMRPIGDVEPPTWATSINDSGQITLNYWIDSMYFYDGSTTIPIGDFHGGPIGHAFDVNNKGQVVGGAPTPTSDDWHAFVWDNGSLSDLGTLGGRGSRAEGINESGCVVGSASTSSGNSHAFMYDGATMIDLNDHIDRRAPQIDIPPPPPDPPDDPMEPPDVPVLPPEDLPPEDRPIDPPSNPPSDPNEPFDSWELTVAYDINESGQIVGVGTHHGLTRAFLLTPQIPLECQWLSDVPEYEWRRGSSPTSAAMLMAYWDQNEFPNLWTGTPPTSNDPGNDSDPVNTVIEHLGDLMGTSSDGLGATKPAKIPKALKDFAEEMDPSYKFKAGNKHVADGAFTFDYLKAEIDAGRPMYLGVMLAAQPGILTDHSVVAYGYQDNTGADNDWIAVRDTWVDGLATGGYLIPNKVEDGMEWWKWVTDTASDFFVYRGGWLVPATEKHAVLGLFESTFSSETAFQEQFDVAAGASGGANLISFDAAVEETALQLVADGFEDIDDCVLTSWIPLAERLGISFDYAFETPGTLQVLIDGVLMAEVTDTLGIGVVDAPSDFDAFSEEFLVRSWGLDPDETYQLEIRLLAGSRHVAFIDNLQITDLDAAAVPEPSAVNMLFGLGIVALLRWRRCFRKN